ncbi:uncharacterized protein LOC134233784 [Saccostrea cucullata]|uniref:uncharacterized protein LOC134233784 n=1 Tax=Saccostrea cuccullata TaxID=36930 RepID=UPI002ED390BA
MDGEDIVVRLTVNLTLPKSDFCTWDGRYFTKCSVIMNDTMQTSKSNGSQISITAPMAKVNINPGVDYTEGDLVTFNCSTNIDPNYSEVSLEINSFVMDQLIMSPIPSERNSDCSVNATWSARSPNPLTTNENGVVIRCIVKNSLLDKSETIEKTLNVSAVDVAFSKYSYSTLTKEVQVIECISRGSSSILQNMTIIRDSAEIVTLNGSGTPMILTSENRYTVTKENDADDIKLILRIKTADCEDQGTYRCSVLTTKNDSRSSPRMTFNVLGATPTLTLNPDIYERFARPGLNHICRTTHTGDIQSDKYLEIQVYRPNDTSGFRYSKKLPESEKEFNSKDNITYINIAGTTARFLLVSDFSTNNSCNNTQTIVFLLDRAMEFDKGIVKCVLRDDNFEYASAAKNITVIPDEYCFGYEDIPKRNHPNNDCHYFVNCAEVGGRMYATGDSCRRPGECMDFSLDYCVDCDENFTCKSPEPVTTTTTLAPGKTYVQCADVSQKEGSPITINCTVLDDTFQSLNVTLTSSSNLNIEEIVGVILPDGTIKNQARSSPVLSTTFSVSSKYIHLIIASSSCMEEGKYLLTDTNVSMDTQPSISDFYFDNLVPVKELTINSESMYKEGKPLMFNCTATVDSDHTELLGYYKLPADNSFVKVQGEQTILQKFTQNCTKSVISMFDTGLIVSANLNGTKLKCLYNEISPEVSEEKNVKIQSADVAFNTYKLKAELQSKANFTCLVRSTGSYKAIKILKIINSTSMMEMASYTSSSDSVQNIAGVDANFSSNALTLIFASVMCSDEGQYNCTVIMDDDAELQPPLSLDVQVTTSPGFSTVELFVNPDIVENKDSGTHHCLGPVGYPEVGGHLEITFVHPLINYNITLNKNSSRTILGNEIKIKSTLEPFTKDECKNMEKISFTINSTKNWNKGKIICEVKNGEHKATKDDIFFVIDGSFCNSTNNQEIYFDHEKEDFCNTYIQCSGGKPFGRSCKPNRCVYIGKTYCEDCSTAVCSEGVTTTEVTLSSFETTPVPGPRCKFLFIVHHRLYMKEKVQRFHVH